MASTSTPRWLLATAALGLSAALAGCSSPSPDQNAQAACSARAALTQSVKDAQTNLTSSSTVAEYKSARENIKKNYEDLNRALSNVQADRKKDMENAWKTFDEKVENLNDETSLTVAATEVKQELTKLQQAQDSATADIKCN
ncbi:hypothetical protein QEH68_20870 [Paenarthrobacter sp. OM7]|uniref:Uncharacterized protein n=1 Tax=Paenarthrobacter sp. AMU7 TaxID=3162492 RepID=A0AB39YNI6_9MICC|nr:hypothetical protein [Paenarthrobacter sp. OM7]WGM20436.1 hypothetical protein QEH68_20870 [Paenarthrobacter sp. OM7]